MVYELSPQFILDSQRVELKFLRDARRSARIANKREFLKILQQRGTNPSGLYTFHFSVEEETLFRQMEQFVGANIVFAKTMEAARIKFAPYANRRLAAIVTAVANAQTEDGAFPKEFLDPILRVISTMPEPQVGGVKPYFAHVDIPDLQQYLGSSEDLALAFHHGATLAKMDEGYQRHSILRGPIGEGNLRYKQSTRYQYWKALYQGKRSIKISSGSSFGISNTGRKLGFSGSETVDIPINGSWDETKKARVAVWNATGKAPQWMLLEHGQPRWKPTVVIPQGFGHSAKAKGKASASDVEGALGTAMSGNISGAKRAYAKAEQGEILPGNITGEWIAALVDLWQTIIPPIWAEQILRFNASSSQVSIDTKAGRLRYKYTAGSHKKGQFAPNWTLGESVFPTSSSSPREFGGKIATRMRNEPLFDRNEWEEIWGDDILDDM